MAEQLPKRELTTVLGFPFPQCGLHIRLSPPVFLHASETSCLGCGLALQLDKSQCGRMIELLHENQ